MGDVLPLRVGLMDDDYSARKGNVSILMRDPRTTVVVEAGTPEELLQRVARVRKVEAVVLDVEYSPAEPRLDILIGELQRITPGITVVCLSQYGRPAVIQAAMTAGVQGFLLKDEIRVAITSAITAACHGRFVITSSVRPQLRSFGNRLLMEAAILLPWKPHPKLTPRLEEAFWLCVFYGMSARLAAEEMCVQPGTVEKYLQKAYGVLQGAVLADETYLYGMDLSQLSPQDRAWIWFTLPRRGRVVIDV